MYTSKPQNIKPLWQDFTYFSHQPAAIEWMMKKEKEGTTIRGVPIFGGILGDEMGLGKTIEMAGLMKNRPVLRTLILTPLAVIGAWTTVLERCGFAVFTFKNHSWVLTAGKRNGGPEAYLTNVDKLLRDTAICNMPWDRVILDEAHKIRNVGSRLFKACKKLEATSRWALTATPIVNKMTDVVALFAFLRVPLRKPLKWAKHMYYWAKDLVMHRSIDSLRDTLPDAPPKPMVHDVICDFETEAEREFYLAIQGAADDAISKRYKRDRIDMAEVFKQLMRLRQISVHPQVFIEARRREAVRNEETYRRQDWDEASTKFIKLAEIIEGNEEKGQQKYIIICHFQDEIGLLKDFLLEGGFMDKVYTYDGSMTAAAREATIKAANAETDRCAIILQLQAGGVGINLQTFNNVVFMSPWWTSAMMDQAIGRAVRMGQKEVVQVYRIFYTQEFERARNIDKLMSDKAEMKRELLEGFWKVVDGTVKIDE